MECFIEDVVYRRVAVAVIDVVMVDPYIIFAGGGSRRCTSERCSVIILFGGCGSSGSTYLALVVFRSSMSRWRRYTIMR